MKSPIKKHVAILGSTGSIGTQALDVIRSNRDKFSVEVLTARSNSELLLQQAIEFSPNAVVIQDEVKAQGLKDVLFDKGIKVFSGEK
jgi:1-deoxy-D-xylulose-5-phosphate reductoisomerase